MTCPRCGECTDRTHTVNYAAPHSTAACWIVSDPLVCTQCLTDWQIRSGFTPWQPGGLQIIGPHSKLNHKEA